MDKNNNATDTPVNINITILNVGHSGQELSDPIQISQGSCGSARDALSQAQHLLSTARFSLPLQQQQQSQQKSSSSEQQSVKKPKFHKRSIAATVALVLHNLGAFNEKQAISEQKIIMNGNKLVQYELSKNPGVYPCEFSASAKKAVKNLLKNNFVIKNEKGYYLTPTGVKVFEPIFVDSDRDEKSSTELTTDSPNKHQDRTGKEKEEEEREKRKRKSVDDGANEEINNSIFICGIYRLKNKSSNKSDVTKSEILDEVKCIQKECPQFGITINESVLYKNIRDGYVIDRYSKYSLSDKGIKLAEEITTNYLGKENNEPPKKCPKTQQNPSEPQTQSASSPQQSDTKTLSMQPKTPVRQLVTAKIAFRDFRVLVPADFTKRMGDELDKRLKEQNMTLNLRPFPISCCLFGTNFGKQFVANITILVPLIGKGNTVVESENTREILEGARKVGFRRVIVLGVSDDTRSKCKEYGFGFKKVTTRMDAIDFITKQSRIVFEKAKTSIDAVPLTEIRF